MGLNTICNPCSVRYRIGRLFPEYRPANSPTFVPTLHFSSHRKVVEMRRKGVGGGFCKERCRGREEEYGRGQKHRTPVSGVPTGQQSYVCSYVALHFSPEGCGNEKEGSHRKVVEMRRKGVKEAAMVEEDSMKRDAEEEKKKPKNEIESKVHEGSKEFRECRHCKATETPQWRKGPMGLNTLCNPCGIRYSTGRLFPEYRPANSPTFVPTLHSTSHRKVVEMRRKGDEEATMVDEDSVKRDTEEEKKMEEAKK
nr:GATA transcription factor 11-like [Ipomoea batatas]